jgi:hypothetical protein
MSFSANVELATILMPIPVVLFAIVVLLMARYLWPPTKRTISLPICVGTNYVSDIIDMKARITHSARKHRCNNRFILEAMAEAGEPTVDGDALLYVGVDSRGVEIEIVAVPDDHMAAVLQ